MIGKIPPSLYAPDSSDIIAEDLRNGIMPDAFTRRMRVINALSAIVLLKFEPELLLPFDVLDLHHILDRQISQDAIIDQLDSKAMAEALTLGNLEPLISVADKYPLLKDSLSSDWIILFFGVPFDPICIMLAMRVKLMLDVIDVMGHSYNLLRAMRLGWIDFGPLPGPLPGPPIDYIPPIIPGPIDIYKPPVPPPGLRSPITRPGQPVRIPPAAGLPVAIPPGVVTIPPGGAPGGGAPRVPPGGGVIAPGMGGGGGGGGAGSRGSAPPMGGGVGGGGGGGSRLSGGGGAPGNGTFGYGQGSYGPYGLSGLLSRAGGAGINCCLDKDNPAANVHIGWDMLDMDCLGTKNLTLVGADPACAGDNYTWELSPDQGTINVDDPFAPVFTAPAGGEDCNPDQTIKLYCGGELIETIGFTINPAPATATIGYTTNQMAVNGAQTLTIVPGAIGCGPSECVLSIKSGGGTLGPPSGNDVIYTAPATNASCANNPTIALTCNGVELDTLEIAVNAAGLDSFYKWLFDALVVSGCKNGALGCVDTVNRYNRYLLRCNGSVTYDSTLNCLEDCGGDWDNICTTTAGMCNHVVLDAEGRSAAQKLAGCCPFQLL